MLFLGEVLLSFAGRIPAILGVVLVLFILVYDAVHKAVTFSPVLMGACRSLVYFIAAATGARGVTGEAVWCGLALGAYVIGLSFLARRESLRGPISYWPVLLMVVPIGLAYVLNTGVFRPPALLLSLILALWVAYCLRRTFWATAPNIGKTVSGLLAGIVFVDWLAVTSTPYQLSIAFVALFVSALIFQRVAPAT
jgi:hypothetical protein